MKFSLVLIAGFGLACSTKQVSLISIVDSKPVEEDTIEARQSAPDSVAMEAQRIAALEASLSEIPLPDIDRKPEPVFDAWQRVLKNFELDIAVDNRRVRMQRNWYAKNQAYMNRVSLRAQRYLYHVIEQIEAQQLPGELALLPIVESAYDPFAYSHGRASGMWQFIPGTGKRFGMKQDWWYDGRRDIVDSTQGALAYLTYLRDEFDGDWLLALAAYNSGEGNVRKAVRKNKKRGKDTDFWSLTLPKETKAYVPKLIALAQLLANPDDYKLEFPRIANQPYFERVPIGSQIDLAQAAQLAEIELNELYLLNPGYNQWATSPKGPHFLNVPFDKAEIFSANLAKISPDERISWIRYTIKNGDSLSTIAQRHNTTAQALKQINNLRSSRIRAGKTLFIPVASQASEHYVLSAAQRLVTKQENPASSGKTKHIHITRSGESFWTIARQYGVGMRELARWNGMATRDPLRIGQKLVVWTRPVREVGTTPAQEADREIIRTIGYTVRNGDSLDRIARKFNVSISDIERWNGISRKKYLQPGQRLKIYVDITRASL